MFNKLIQYSVCSCLTQLILFDGRGVFTLLPKVQTHVSALKNSHLQVVHESLESILNIPGYYKRNRHLQCCIETKLLMI